MIKKIFILLLAAAAAFLIYTQIQVSDYTKMCVSVSDSVDEILLGAGYTDSDVTNQYRRHLKKENATWIEFNKTLSRGFPPDGKAMESLSEMVSKRKGLSIVRKKISRDEEGIFIMKGDKTFYILRFPSLEKPAEQIQGIAPQVTSKRKVAIVIDDLGYKFPPPEEFLSLGIPLTYAILPMERYSKETADFFAKRGIDFLIHFPMEPDDPFENPGKAAVLLNMDEKEIARQFHKAIQSVPGAVGISNHMGSAFSRSEEKMEIFLSLAKSKGLFYFDSHTSQKSVARKVGQKIGTDVIVNQFFLDNEDTEEAIEKEMRRVLSHARRKPVTIAIGHIHKKHLVTVLKKYIPEFHAANIEFVPLKSLICAPNR